MGSHLGKKIADTATASSDHVQLSHVVLSRMPVVSSLLNIGSMRIMYPVPVLVDIPRVCLQIPDTRREDRLLSICHLPLHDCQEFWL